MPTLNFLDRAVQLDLPPIVQGEDWQWSFQLQNPDGTAVDTTGMSFTCMMRESKAARTVTFTPTVTIATNTVTLKLANAVTTAVTQTKRLVYDIFQTDSLGNKLPLFEGAVQFEEAVTR